MATEGFRWRARGASRNRPTHFLDETKDVRTFVGAVSFRKNADMFQSWLHDYAIIRAYTAFEDLMLDALVGAINDDTTTISTTTGVKFPMHLTDEMCEYLVTDRQTSVADRKPILTHSRMHPILRNAKEPRWTYL